MTIRDDLLRLLDRTIDHQRIRNRSHALEVILSRTLSTSTKQAVILASGQGVNMRPFTYEIPKPLIPVGGKPILEHTIELLRHHGITNIIITVSYLADRIQKHFGDGKEFGVNISYVTEKQPSGTAGALKSARSQLKDAPFLMLYGDVLADLDAAEFLHTHEHTRAAIGTLALTSVPDPSTFGAVKMRGTRVVSFSEKPPIDPTVSRLIFAGIAAFDPAVFEFFPARRSQELSLEQTIFPRLIEEGRLFGYPFEGQWFDVSTPEVYEAALKQWGQGA